MISIDNCTMAVKPKLIIRCVAKAREHATLTLKYINARESDFLLEV